MDWEVAGQTDENGEGAAPAPKPPKRKGGKMKKGVIVVLVIVALFVILQIANCGKSSSEAVAWPSSGLATMLPEPPATVEYIWTNNDEELSVSLKDSSDSKYADYVEQCKAKGFTVDAVNDTSSYEAFTEDGYYLQLSEIGDSMSIDLDAPIEMGDLAWPTSGAGSYAPKPASNQGKISSDTSTSFYAYVGETDTAAYSAYVDSCMAAGFDIDYNRGDKNFWADNSNGSHITVEYRGFNMMSVRVTVDDDASESATTSEPAAESEAAAESPAAAEVSSSNGDFRQFVDDYESFMNSYCDFMESYANSSNPVAMAADYASMMSQYAEWTSKFDNYDTSGVSADDLAYYTAAQTRVLERVSKVS